MKIVSIEPTPNPNTMKLNLDTSLPDGVQMNYTAENERNAPPHVRRLLAIPGLKGVYQVADFIALTRAPGAAWPAVLAQARGALAEGAKADASQADGRPLGEVRVFVQMLRGIPMQMKLVAGLEELRVALPERIAQAARTVAGASADLLAERAWKDRGLRYGELSEVVADVVSQLEAVYDEERLAKLVERALRQEPGQPPPIESLPPAAVAERLADPDWRRRYAALEQMEDPTPEALPVLEQALGDPHHGVRRLAAVYLGQLGGPESLALLCRTLQDPSAAVRRAAGDCLSDLGDPAAMPAMIEALRDPSKLVRWRAARFLYEVGDGTALPALRAAQDDPEFEISLQVKMAIERIEGGGEAAGPAWQQMTRLQQQSSQAGDVKRRDGERK